MRRWDKNLVVYINLWEKKIGNLQDPMNICSSSILYKILYFDILLCYISFS